MTHDAVVSVDIDAQLVAICCSGALDGTADIIDRSIGFGSFLLERGMVKGHKKAHYTRRAPRLLGGFRAAGKYLLTLVSPMSALGLSNSRCHPFRFLQEGPVLLKARRVLALNCSFRVRGRDLPPDPDQTSIHPPPCRSKAEPWSDILPSQSHGLTLARSA